MYINLVSMYTRSELNSCGITEPANGDSPCNKMGSCNLNYNLSVVMLKIGLTAID